MGLVVTLIVLLVKAMQELVHFVLHAFTATESDVILGVLTRIVAALLALNMLGALFLVHAPAGVFADKGGYELVLLLAAAALALALTGAGRVSVDRALFGRKNSRLAVLA